MFDRSAKISSVGGGLSTHVLIEKADLILTVLSIRCILRTEGV